MIIPTRPVFFDPSMAMLSISIAPSTYLVFANTQSINNDAVGHTLAG